MASDLLAAMREKTRTDREREKENDDEVVAFQKIPPVSRLEDLEIGALMHE
jgi:hypothetical protein